MTWLQVTTTFDDQASARKVATAVVEEKLAACVHVIGPIRGIYRWEGELNDGEEWICQFKTMERDFDRLERRVKELHSYETPEVAAIPFTRISKDYATWLDKTVK